MGIPERENLFSRVNHKVRDLWNAPADPSKRELLRTAVLGVEVAATSAVVLACRGIPDQQPVRLGLQTEPLFSGEIEETKAYIAAWEEEVRQNPNLKEQRIEDAAKLAIAFFNNQLGYPSNHFEGQVVLINRNAYRTKYAECGAINFKPGFVDPLDDKAYIDKTTFIAFTDSQPITETFALVLHELGHLDPPTIKHPPKENVDGYLNHEKGLIMYMRILRTSATSDRCFPQVYGPIEEAVNHDSIVRLLALVDIKSTDPTYLALVQKYRAFILDYLFDGDYQELLTYQRQTNRLAFFRSIGERLMRKTNTLVEDIQEQINLGTQYINGSFPK